MSRNVLAISTALSLPLDAVGRTFAILSQRGAGKTTLMLVMAEEMLHAHQAVVVIDKVGVAWGLRASADGRHPGLPILIAGGAHGDLPLDSDAGAALAERVVTDDLSLVLDLSLLDDDEALQVIEAFARRLYFRNRTPRHVFIDESDLFCAQRPERAIERKTRAAVAALVTLGRARGLGCTLVTQRSASLAKRVLTQVETLIVLRTPAPQDRVAIQAWITAQGVSAEHELLASLPTLPVGTAWVWSPAWLDYCHRVPIRRRETWDSSATPTPGAPAKMPQAWAPVNAWELSALSAITIQRAAGDPAPAAPRSSHSGETHARRARPT